MSCCGSCHNQRKAPVQRPHPSAQDEGQLGAVLLSTRGRGSGRGLGLCPTMWQGSPRPGICSRSRLGQGDPRAGWGEQQDRLWGAAPTLEQTAPVHRCCSEGPFESPEMCPSDKPCSELVSPRAHHAAPAVRLSVPSPSCPSAPAHSVNGVICCSFHPLPGCPQPRTPIHFTHDLVLSYFGKCRVPPWPRGRLFTLRSTHGCTFQWPRSPSRCHRSLELSLNGIDSSGTAWRWFPLGWRETRSLS